MQEAFSLFPDFATSDGHISGLVGLCKLALDRGDTEEALRLTDRAIRLAQDNFHLRILRGTTLLKANLPHQAIDHFSKAISVGGSPDGEIGLAYAYLTLGDIQAAADLARSLVGRFACGDFGMIAPLLRRVCKSLGKDGRGWVSVTADGRLVGSIDEAQLKKNGDLIATAASTGHALAKETVEQLVLRASQTGSIDGFIDFEFQLRATDYSEAIRVQVDGIDLIGSPAHAPSASQIEGFVERLGDQITGWVVLTGHPKARLSVRLIDQQGIAREFATIPGPAGEHDGGRPVDAVARQRFSIDLVQFGLNASRVEIWGWLPALAVGNQLTGSPLGGETVPRANRPAVEAGTAKRRRGKTAKRPIDIVIPVFGNASETLACLNSVIETKRNFGETISECEIVVIDDASQDGDLAGALALLAADGKISLLHNERNLGFPTSVNRGFDLHPDRDVVVLNSDTIVFADWLPRLRAAAYSAPVIGTVTPFSNEGSILSYPMSLGENPEPSVEDAATLDRIASDVNAGLTVDIPTAVGFCMYVRRDCLNEVGIFDVSFFGRGYGEENDLCMRASAAGWRNIAAPNVFVTHVGGRSFGASKKMLVARNTDILNRLHPGYDALVRDFIAADMLAGARRNIDIARLRRKIAGSAILLVTLGLAGGVARNVQEATERYAARGLKTFILRPLQAADRDRARAILVDPSDDTLCNLIFDLPDDLEMLSILLSECGVGKVEIHHFLGLDASIFSIADRLGAPYEIVLHDYSWLCPRINLVDGRGQYCGMPVDPQICDRCVAIDGGTLEEKLPVLDLRQRSATILAGALRVVAPCEDVVDRFNIFASDAAYGVTPWEELPLWEPAAPPHLANGRIRVAVIGAIGEQKGYDLLLACARDAALRDLPIEFVVIGHTSDDLRLFKTGRVFVTGRYDEDEAVELIRMQSCHFAFLPSVSPETWSYTLTLAWKAGLKALAFDFGAIAERIRGSGYGHIIPFSTDEKAVNLAIVNFDKSVAFDIGEASDVGVGGVSMVQHEQGGGALVASIENFDDGNWASRETLVALEPGLYAFSVRAPETEGGEPTLPVVQISLAAGHVRDVKVDFLGKHDPVENWLTDEGDVVVVRIAGGPASMLIKCLYVPGRDFSATSVECRRLDQSGNSKDEATSPKDQGRLTAQITAHIQNRGDIPFIAPAWAGCVGEHLWIEAFTINPLEGLLPEDIEYKALTGTGFETPWISGGNICGTRGTSNPLIAFAVRLRGSAAERYECRYRGTFLGTGIVGPFRNGAACKSVCGRDPLEGIELEIVERTWDVSVDDQGLPEPSVPEYEVVYGSY